MLKKIRVAVIGYGNIGRYAVEAIQAAQDFELCGVVTRRIKDAEFLHANFNVVTDIAELGSVEVALVCLPSQLISTEVTQLLKRKINTVDCFDVHHAIVELREKFMLTARENDCVAITATGWDPGSDSIIRALLLVMAPAGVTYTNFGPGMSMGHSVAVKMLKGVKDAVSLTIPTGTGLHRRMVYVVLQPDADPQQIKQAILSNDYFINDETHVTFLDSVAQFKDAGHGVLLQHKGIAGQTHNPS